MTERADIPDSGRLVVISGPSGSGKTSIIDSLRADPRVLVSVSVTTRPPREHEVAGRDYHFVTRDRFMQMHAAAEFIETNEVFGNGHLYGSLWSDLREALARDCVYIMEVDVVGARSLAEAGLQPLSIFIEPPSMELLEQRLRSRGTDPEAAIARRLERAREELEEARTSGAVPVKNDSLDRAVAEVRRLCGLDPNDDKRNDDSSARPADQAVGRRGSQPEG